LGHGTGAAELDERASLLLEGRPRSSKRQNPVQQIKQGALLGLAEREEHLFLYGCSVSLAL
jgi:hypothetical protein